MAFVSNAPLVSRLTRRGRLMAKRTCDRRGHAFAFGRFLFRTPTAWEYAAAVAGGSDPAAQRWLGWLPESVVAEPMRGEALRVVPGTGPDWTTPDPHSVDVVAIDLVAGRCAGLVSVHAGEDGGPETGGYLAPGYRGQGFGRDLFAAGLILAHEHLGLSRVRAGAEVGNVASGRSLEGAGLRRVPGPPRYTLPDGRACEASWYQHDAAWPRKCAGPQAQWLIAS
ncbi:N-acetyltransferase [Amycolatopsis sp. AA4]|uniref:GNAT family N-acetyltransferase n=1 Tax=Amycolatopsis sp. AA4 TaxID=1896961 RepID=UPI0002ECD6C9|nr:GNAT family protein [Amycolatopsis sp. AA4]ATY16808.1 N-acetyltransferase [Amycolatopsis sp. AA4]